MTSIIGEKERAPHEKCMIKFNVLCMGLLAKGKTEDAKTVHFPHLTPAVTKKRDVNFTVITLRYILRHVTPKPSK